MRRRHTREEYLDLVGRIRESIPGVTLSTDMIVGFPGQTADDFDQTMSLTAAARYASMFSFKYSPRPNTLAAKRMTDDVSEPDKTERIVALQALQREVQTRLMDAAVGSVVEVLVDSVSRHQAGHVSGRSAGNTVVSFSVDGGHGEAGAAWLGRTAHVRITRATPHKLVGELATNGILSA